MFVRQFNHKNLFQAEGVQSVEALSNELQQLVMEKYLFIKYPQIKKKERNNKYLQLDIFDTLVVVPTT
jgi:hypothetical protein